MKEIRFDDVSKFYGEVLGVNRVSLTIPPGITSLVGPNGSGKTTLMNLTTGLLRPTKGRVEVLGLDPSHGEELFRRVGYCTQFDTFPRGFTGIQFVAGLLRLHGWDPIQAERLGWKAIERVGLVEAGKRQIAGYSKGMRQRIKLAQAIAHEPEALILDEPLNGLDPMARAEMIALFQELAHEGQHVIISSHILHEVDMISDTVIFVDQGYVVAEGDVQDVRHEMDDIHPMQVEVVCDQPAVLAAKLFQTDHVVEARIAEDRRSLLAATRDPDSFYLLLNKMVVEEGLVIDSVSPADDSVQAVYNYLISDRRESAL